MGKKQMIAETSIGSLPVTPLTPDERVKVNQLLLDRDQGQVTLMDFMWKMVPFAIASIQRAKPEISEPAFKQMDLNDLQLVIFYVLEASGFARVYGAHETH